MTVRPYNPTTGRTAVRPYGRVLFDVLRWQAIGVHKSQHNTQL